MSKRKAILTVGYTEFITDVTTALMLEEKLSELTQVTSRYVDPDVDEGVVPCGFVWIPETSPSRIEAKLVEKQHSFVDDVEWYDSVVSSRLLEEESGDDTPNV
jgi:hypothetical protein|tara:strand:- start:456 stop:764 length:309 start_codon:yes stop_codon:yes gene_type:complete